MKKNDYGDNDRSQIIIKMHILTPFDEEHVLHELKHYLPSQQALKDFIHHNSLHAFQHMKFYDAIFKASKIFGFQVHLQLSEYREMYKTGRIREDMLQMVIANKKELTCLDGKKNMLNKEYDTINHPRIGQLRKLLERCLSAGPG